MTRVTVPPDRVEVRAITLSIESRVRDDDVRDLIRDKRPHVASIVQAYRAGDFLDRIPGYRLRQFGDWIGAEGPAVALLVRDDVEIEARTALEMREPWVGPKAGKRHEPRVYPELDLVLEGLDLTVVGVHFPTGGPDGPNDRAWAESAARQIRRARRHPGSRLIIGDFNALADELKPLASRLEGEVWKGTKVDHAIGVDLKHLGTRRYDVPRGLHGFVQFRAAIPSKES